VYLKLENYQRTGSFKLRGAVNKILALGPEAMSKILVTSSTGNHGSAFAWAVQRLGLRGKIFVPENIEPSKLESLKGYQLEIEFHGEDCVESEKRAREAAGKEGMIYISPYNDIMIVAGQGTAALEADRQAGEGKIDSLLVPVGGGGLISGIAGYFRAEGRKMEIAGCQPENSPVMARSVEEGRIVDMESKPTISDGTAGGIEPGSITFDICSRYVDDFILLSEKEIEEAIKIMLRRHSMLVEGSAALSVAALIREKRRFEGKRVVLLISGSRLDPRLLRRIICAD
jgi:threonine dehydratase